MQTTLDYHFHNSAGPVPFTRSQPSGINRSRSAMVTKPLVTTQDFFDLLTLSEDNPEKICCASYQNTIGITALFPRKFFEELLTLHGDEGAKKILMNK